MIKALVFALRLDKEALNGYRRNLRFRSERKAQLALASALSLSPDWSAQPATFVVKPGEQPLIGILTEVDTAQASRIGVQIRAAEKAIGRLRYITYEEAERHADRLAEKLIRRFGAENVRGFRYAAIPRGGLIVLGMLAALLDLPPSQLSGESLSPDTPLVVVDDCALSGARFGSFLATCNAERVIFAHLGSNPELRTAIETREPRVSACLAAFDLEDHGPRLEGYADARARWSERLGPCRYWIGDTEGVCFPWNEPDRLVWDPSAQRIESGWRLLPPERCIKQRAARPPAGIRVEVQPSGRGPLRPSRSALFGSFGGETLLATLDRGETFLLAGSGQEIWWALVKHGSTGRAVAALANRYRVEEAILRADLETFVESLLARGLLELDEAPPL